MPRKIRQEVGNSVLTLIFFKEKKDFTENNNNININILFSYLLTQIIIKDTIKV